MQQGIVHGMLCPCWWLSALVAADNFPKLRHLRWWLNLLSSEEGQGPELVTLLLTAVLLERLPRLEDDGDGGDGQHCQGDLRRHARAEDCTYTTVSAKAAAKRSVSGRTHVKGMHPEPKQVPCLPWS